jgi:DNA-binding HxlR family transcriptional regulator
MNKHATLEPTKPTASGGPTNRTGKPDLETLNPGNVDLETHTLETLTLETLTLENVNLETLEHHERISLQPECTVERTLDVIGGKWTTLILRDLLGGTKRFGQLRSSLGGIPPKTLTERLRDLERHGALERVQYPEIPPRVEYTLTEKGRALGAIIDAMADWGSRWT